MDLEVIDTIFTFGKFAALTPSSTNNHNPHCLQKLYEICVYLLYVVGFSASIYAKFPLFLNLMPIEFVLAILYDLNQFCLRLLHFDRHDETAKESLVPTYQESRCCQACAEENSTQVNLRSVTTGLLLFDDFRSLRQCMVYQSHCSRILPGRALPKLRSVLLLNFHHNHPHLAAVTVRASQRDSLTTNQSQESTPLKAGC
jgi:hypothetical protein